MADLPCQRLRVPHCVRPQFKQLHPVEPQQSKLRCNAHTAECWFGGACASAGRKLHRLLCSAHVYRHLCLMTHGSGLRRFWSMALLRAWRHTASTVSGQQRRG
jgi:hypothetical protein